MKFEFSLKQPLSRQKTAFCVENNYNPFRENDDGNNETGMLDFADAVECFAKQLKTLLNFVPPSQGDKKAKAAECSCLENFGNAHCTAGHHADALMYYEKAMMIAKKHAMLPVQASIYNNIGNAFRALSMPGKAILNLKHSLGLYQQLRDLTNQASVLNSIGCLYAAEGNYDKSIQYLKLCESLCAEVHEETGLTVAQVYLSIGKVFLDMSRAMPLSPAAAAPATSPPPSQQGGAPAAQGPSPSPPPKSSESPAQPAGPPAVDESLPVADRGQLLHESLRYHSLHLEAAQRLKDKQMCANANRHLAVVCRDMDMLEDAVRYLKDSFRMAQKCGDSAAESLALEELGKTYISLNDLVSASKWFQRFLDIARQQGNLQGEGRACMLIGEAYKIAGKLKG